MAANYYVRAIKGAGINAQWRPLVGPFSTAKAAHGMLMPVERACQRAGRYKGCTFGVWKSSKHYRAKLPLDLISLDDMIEASRVT